MANPRPLRTSSLLMIVRNTPWSPETENELRTQADEACNSAKDKKADYDALLGKTSALNTYDERKRHFKLLTAAMQFWMAQVDNCRAWRKAYNEHRASRRGGAPHCEPPGRTSVL